MMRLVRVSVAICFFCFCARLELRATGYYGPDNYLDRGGENVDASPEFYWEIEVQRLASAFHPTEKPVAPELPKDVDYSERGAKREQSVKADTDDFVAALKEGRIKPPDPAKAQTQHEAARKMIEQSDKDSTEILPEEFASEFEEYHRGAHAYAREDFAGAAKIWEALLKRPAEERHYRTTWAAFMLGRAALKTDDFAGAAKIFPQVRESARAGFADSLGLAAASYGWEGRAEWKQDHPAKAAELFLTQLALGDYSAIISLKALVPDREPIEGMLNYGPELDDRAKWDEATQRAYEEKEIAALKAAARDPLLRKLVTSHILATASVREVYTTESGSKPVNRCARWLAAVNEAKPGQIEDAEYLGWVAYNNGDYKGAARWLEMAKADAPAALWLKAKLQRRAGKLAEAAQNMAKAWESLRDLSIYTGGVTGTGSGEGDQDAAFSEGLHWSFRQSASGDLGALRLTRGDFVQAFDTFRAGGLWNDAAFVAERVLTANELKNYVDQQTEPESEEGKTAFERMRYLLGRRLVREDQYNDAAKYLRPPYDKVLQRYAKALRDGADEKLGKEERARAWFTAAWLARYDGMELMGTEAAPDTFVEDGQFELPDLAKQFASGKFETVKYDEKGNERKIASPISLKVSKEGLQRLAKNKISPDKRFHYRLIAGELAMKAAKLLPDNSEELADVVNMAGLWVKDRDEKAGDRYFLVLKQRAGNTTIGKAAVAKHWFVDEQGTWSKEQTANRLAMLKELELPTPDQ